MMPVQPAYASASPRGVPGRGTDRRRGVAELLSAVASGLSVLREPNGVRERFEEELRLIVRARSVAVCDGTLSTPAPNVRCFDVPVLAPPQRARIEIVFESGRTLDGWTCHVLEAAAHIAAVLLELERAQGRPPQFARVRGDGAAPLIGSSRAIRDVRERIERVAATDFTVLIEGESGPQPHPSFVEVCREAAVCHRYWQVEGARDNTTGLPVASFAR
jgi:hypothetical protein